MLSVERLPNCPTLGICEADSQLHYVDTDSTSFDQQASPSQAPVTARVTAHGICQDRPAERAAFLATAAGMSDLFIRKSIGDLARSHG